MKNRITKGRLIGAILVTLVLGTSSLYGQTLGEQGPDFEVDLLGGKKFKLSDQKGKVVFVFLFGNGCTSCKAIGPKVESDIYQKFKENDSFAAVGLDTWDSSSGTNSVTGFKDATGISFPLAIKAGSVATAYSTTYDRLMVIDQNGILVHKGSVLASNDLDNAVAAINESLSVVGIGDPASNHNRVKVFPVPANDVVHFEAEESIMGITLFDASGRMVLEEAFGRGNYSRTRNISLEPFQKGLYFYTLQLEGSRLSGKLLIQR